MSEKQAVFVEKSALTKDNGSPNVELALIGIFHYAVKVGDEWYEVSNDDGTKKNLNKIRNTSDCMRQRDIFTKMIIKLILIYRQN